MLFTPPQASAIFPLQGNRHCVESTFVVRPIVSPQSSRAKSSQNKKTHPGCKRVQHSCPNCRPATVNSFCWHAAVHFSALIAPGPPATGICVLRSPEPLQKRLRRPLAPPPCSLDLPGHKEMHADGAAVVVLSLRTLPQSLNLKKK